MLKHGAYASFKKMGLPLVGLLHFMMVNGNSDLTLACAMSFGVKCFSSMLWLKLWIYFISLSRHCYIPLLMA